jgi:predicted peroxiredoxin
MYNEDTELIFPNRVIPDLAELRGTTWQKLVEEVSNSESDSEDQLAFVLMMAKIDGCMTCNADSFRAMKGCTLCAQDSVRRYRGTDAELLKKYKQAQKEMIKLRDANG